MKKLNHLIIVCVISIKGFAWGHEGHEMVALIAKSYCSKSVQDSVNKYLDGLSWEKAGTWMDDVRGDQKYDRLKPFHYINVEKDKTYVYEYHDKDNIIKGIKISIAQLQIRSKKKFEDVQEDLKILFHLLGDLHQPLHVGYGEDKGGNTIEVDYNGKLVKLHHLWDTDILVAHMKQVQDDVITLCKTTSKDEIQKLQETNCIDWMNEGRTLLPKVYDFKNGTITKEYEERAVKIIEKQIFEAGVRLAGVLNSLFK